jgi:hypothetical protein
MKTKIEEMAREYAVRMWGGHGLVPIDALDTAFISGYQAATQEAGEGFEALKEEFLFKEFSAFYPRTVRNSDFHRLTEFIWSSSRLSAAKELTELREEAKRWYGAYSKSVEERMLILLGRDEEIARLKSELSGLKEKYE